MEQSSVYFYFCLITVSRANTIITRQGKLEGTSLIARNGRQFNAYYGVPYAKPPVGDLRFQPPVPLYPWTGVRNASVVAQECPQYPEYLKEYAGVEDCLYVDVYTPSKSKPGDNLPVIVYIYGGIFKFGNTQREGPQYFMGRDIILVMVSSRLGVLGFFTTGDSVIAGNMGLKDQAMALRWTREYIYDYGGDPNKITLAGHSSGSACVHLHTLSPLSKGLFDRVIMESGVGVNPQSFFDEDVASHLSREVARRANCEPDSSVKILECLQKMDVKDIVTIANEMSLWHQIPEAVFRPTIEDKNVKHAFLTENPLFAPYPSTRAPWLIGMTSGEGAYYVNEYFSNMTGMDMNPELLFPLMGLYFWTTKPNHRDYITKVLVAHFLGGERLGTSTDFELADLLTGAMHGMGLVDVVQQYKGTKYVYLYDYKANYSGQFTVGTYGKYLGVAHADEVNLFFRTANSVSSLSKDDIKFSEELITRWVNFAYSGNPNRPFPINEKLFGSWNTMKSSRIEYLRIKMNGSMEADYIKNKNEFWKKIPFFSKYK